MFYAINISFLYFFIFPNYSVILIDLFLFYVLSPASSDSAALLVLPKLTTIYLFGRIRSNWRSVVQWPTWCKLLFYGPSPASISIFSNNFTELKTIDFSRIRTRSKRGAWHLINTTTLKLFQSTFLRIGRDDFSFIFILFTQFYRIKL